MFRRQSHVFIEIKGRHLRKIESLLAIHPHKLAIRRNRRRASGESQNAIRFGPHEFRNNPGRDDASFRRRGLNDDFHDVGRGFGTGIGVREARVKIKPLTSEGER